MLPCWFDNTIQLEGKKQSVTGVSTHHTSLLSCIPRPSPFSGGVLDGAADPGTTPVPGRPPGVTGARRAGRRRHTTHR